MNEQKEYLSKRKQLLAASTLIPIIGALSRPLSLQALIYTFFVAIYLAPVLFKKSEEEKHPPATPLVSGLNFFIALIGAGLISECLAWLSQMYASDSVPLPADVLHTQFIPDLYLALFYTAGVAIAWLLLLTKYRFALGEVFFITFIIAMGKELQLGRLATICTYLVTDPVGAVLTLASILVVSGSVSALGFLAGGKLARADKNPASGAVLLKLLLSLLIVGLLPQLTTFAGIQLSHPIGLNTEKHPN